MCWVNDIYCCKCGIFLFTEEKRDDDEIVCTNGNYGNGYYDGKEDQFYCLECAEKYGKE